MLGTQSAPFSSLAEQVCITQEQGYSRYPNSTWVGRQHPPSQSRSWPEPWVGRLTWSSSSPHLTSPSCKPNLFKTLSPAHRGMNLWTQPNLSTQHHTERRWKNSPWTAAQEARLCWGQLTTEADRGRNWPPHMGSCPPVTRPDRGLDTDQSDWHLFLSLGQEVTMKEK